LPLGIFDIFGIFGTFGASPAVMAARRGTTARSATLGFAPAELQFIAAIVPTE
jgi:hypothetical protein